MLKSKWAKVFIFSILLLSLLFLGGRTFIHRKIDDIIRIKLVENSGDDIWIKYRQSHLNFIQSSISFDGINISNRNDTTENWKTTIHELKVYGLSPLALLNGDGIIIDSIEIDRPKLSGYAISEKHKGIVDSNPDTIKVKKRMQMKISMIRVNNGVIDYDPNGPELLSAQYNLHIKDFELEKFVRMDETIFNMVDISFSDINYQFPDSVYAISAKSIDSSSQKDEISIEQFSLFSNLSEVEFPAKFGWRKSRINFDSDEIIIDKPHRFSTDSVFISMIDIATPRLKIHKDNRYPWPNRKTELPQVLLENIPVRFQIDSITTNRGSFDMVSIMENGDKARLNMSEINAHLRLIQNHDSLLPAFSFSANAKLMEQASLQLSTVYSYGPNSPFTCQGSIGNTKLEFLAEYLAVLSGIKIEDGILNELNFKMEGNTYANSGYMDFLYDNLVIHAVNKETGQDKKLVNFFSNIMGGLVFWDENPSKQEQRRGRFYVERDVRRGFISQWIDGILEGIIETVSKVDASKMEQMRDNMKIKKEEKKKHKK